MSSENEAVSLAATASRIAVAAAWEPCSRARLRLQPGKAPKDAAGRFGVAGNAVDPGDVAFRDGFDIVGRVGERPASAHADGGRPAAAADGEGQRVEVRARAGSRRIGAREEIAEGHLPGGFAALPQRHRPHPEARDAADARVERRVRLRGNGRAGQDEQPLRAGAVDRMPNRVPERRRDLPFVDETGLVPLQETARPDGRQFEVLGEPIRLVQIQDALRRLFRGRRLAAPFQPFDEDGALDFEGFRKPPVRDSLSVGFHTARF